jgi:hypothetical protein
MFAEITEKVYAVHTTEKDSEALYRWLSRHGHQHWAIPQALNVQGLKTFFVVTDWPEGELLQDPFKEVLVAIERWPKGRKTGYMSTSPGVRVKKEENQHKRISAPVNDRWFELQARAEGRVIEEDATGRVKSVEMPAFGDPDWQATFDRLRKRPPQRPGREGFFRRLGLSTNDLGRAVPWPGPGEPGAPEREGEEGCPR